MLLFDENMMPDCFIFTETWHDGNIPILLPGYTGYHTVRQIRRSGGVSIFVKDSLKSEFIHDLSFANENIEICTLKVSNETSQIILCGVYRPHMGTIENFTHSLEGILGNRQLNNSNCLVGGDLNIDISSNFQGAEVFVDMMRSHHFLQTINHVTRPSTSNSAPSLLDHIWINNVVNYNSGIIKTGVSDHYTTFIMLPFKHKTINCKKIKISFRDCSECNQAVFENKLSIFNWERLKSYDPSTYLQNFLTCLNTLYQEAFPLKTKFITQKYFKNPWHNKDVKRLSDARKKYHQLLLLNLVSHEQYSSFRNKITNLIRKHKEKYYVEAFTRNFGDSKKTWGTIRELCNGKNNFKTIDEIFYNGVHYQESNEIAALFNKYFVTISHDLAAALPPPVHSPYMYVQSNNSPPIELNPVSCVEVSSIIASAA